MGGDSQREYADAAERWFAGVAGPARLRRCIDDDAAAQGEASNAMRDFGLGELIAAEPDAGERARILAAVALQAGRHLYAGPLAEAIAQEMIGLPAVYGTRVLIALPDAGGAPPTWDRKSGLLTGTLAAVPYANSAERWLIAAIDEHSPVLVGAAPAPATARIAVSRQADGTANAILQFSAHPAEGCGVIASDAQTDAAIAEIRDLLVMSTAARLIGAAEQAAMLGRDYLKLRTQFGRTLASFQALQHQAVDHYIKLELAQALLDQVLAHWSEPATRRVALPALKAFSGTAGLDAAKNAVQMFGAMGFAHETDVGLYLRHVMTLAYRYGDALAHRHAFSALEFDFLR